MTKPTIDELEMLNPFELWDLLINEVYKVFPDVQRIHDLIAVGCPIDPRDSLGRTALYCAAISGNFDVVIFLVSKGADIDTGDINGCTPLHLAARCGWIDGVRFLTSKGADIHARTNYGSTAWDFASMKFRETCPELEPK